MAEGIGDRFQQETKYNRNSMDSGIPDLSIKPEFYKEYPDCNLVTLPFIKSSELPSMKPIYEVFSTLRRTQQFSDIALSLGHLIYLLWSSTGIQRCEIGYKFQTVPAVGPLYPIETYLIINNITSIDNGIYHYSLKNHALEELRLGDFRGELTEATLGQQLCSEAAVAFIWTAIFHKSKWQYKQRAYRYIYMDVGHIAEKLAIAATALDLGTCQIGALFDDELNNIIGVDGTIESVIYVSLVGHPYTP